MTEFDRRQGIGASEAPAVLGLDPYRSAAQLWAVKRGLVPEDDRPPSPALLIGHLLEEPVARLYADRTGYRVQRHRRSCADCRRAGREAFCRDSAVFDPDHPWLFAHLDRVVRGSHVVEIKTHAGRGEEWGPDGSGEVPLRVAVQATLQMRLAKLPAADVVAFLWGRDLRVYRLTYDQQLADGIVDQLARFWGKVQAGVEPPIDPAHPSTAAYLAGRHPLPSDDMVDVGLDPVATRLVDVYLEARRAVAAATEAREHAANLIKQRIGAAGGLLYPGGRITWRAQERRVVDWHAVAQELAPQPLDAYSGLIEEHTSTSSTRVLRVHEQGGDE